MIEIEVWNKSDIFLEASVEKWYNFPGLRFTSKIFDLTLKNTSIGAENFFLCWSFSKSRRLSAIFLFKCLDFYVKVFCTLLDKIIY